MRTVGVLALQGDFEKHSHALERAGARVRAVRTAEELLGLDGLIVPGGESTTMRHLMGRGGLLDPLARFVKEKPVMGTCAGLILLANTVDGDRNDSPLAVLDVSIKRNAFGRQVDSFTGRGVVEIASAEHPLEMVFIRAPRIVECGVGVVPCGRLTETGEVVMVRAASGPPHVGLSFHPELTDDAAVHRAFVESL